MCRALLSISGSQTSAAVAPSARRRSRQQQYAASGRRADPPRLCSCRPKHLQGRPPTACSLAFSAPRRPPHGGRKRRGTTTRRRPGVACRRQRRGRDPPPLLPLSDTQQEPNAELGRVLSLHFAILKLCKRRPTPFQGSPLAPVPRSRMRPPPSLAALLPPRRAGNPGLDLLLAVYRGSLLPEGLNVELRRATGLVRRH